MFCDKLRHVLLLASSYILLRCWTESLIQCEWCEGSDLYDNFVGLNDGLNWIMFQEYELNIFSDDLIKPLLDFTSGVLCLNIDGCNHALSN
jgi:hypothetical protein